MEDYYEDIKTALFDNGTPYKIHRMIFTANKGSVTSATFNGTPTSEHNDRIAMKIAKFVMWCESIHNDRSKVLEDAVEISTDWKMKRIVEFVWKNTKGEI
ncbi:hypothetical protein L1987_61702 [Smallanthus sonchifolius]|nr:hypothetical protein L1987_61702 [Smallanthus sonchifolius]